MTQTPIKWKIHVVIGKTKEIQDCRMVGLTYLRKEASVVIETHHGNMTIAHNAVMSGKGIGLATTDTSNTSSEEAASFEESATRELRMWADLFLMRLRDADIVWGDDGHD